MKVTLRYLFDVDLYEEKEFYFGEIIHGTKVIYSHEEALKCFSFKEDMIRHLHIKCAELGYEIEDIIDETHVSSLWEEQI